jgi:protein TonB
MMFLVLAIAVHMLLFFGINFGVSLNPAPRLADTLEVVLVNWRSEEEPDKADYLAQASQQGGGETAERLRPSAPVSGILPTLQDGQDSQQLVDQIPAPQVDAREIVSVETENETILRQTTIEQQETEHPNASEYGQPSTRDRPATPMEVKAAKTRVYFRQHEGIRICQLYEHLGFKS